MRKFLVLAIGLGVLVAVTIAASPWLSETKLAWDCPETEAAPSDDCLKRMRAAGHMWSRLSNLSKAEHWYLRGSKAGDPIAMFHLAWVEEGFAREVIGAGMIEMAEQMALAPIASITTGDFDPADPSSLFGEFAFLPEYHAHIDQAESWYKKSAERGFAPSMNNLAQIYAMNPVRKPAYNTALKLYRKAAEAGNPIAHWNIGMTYSAGKGVQADHREAEKWWTWTPSDYDEAQFDWPTLERTHLFGTKMPRQHVADLRYNAEHGLPVTTQPRQLKPSRSVSNFAGVREELNRRAKPRE